MNIDELLISFQKYNNNKEDLEMIERSFNYADKMHKGQKRKSGEDYIIHPIKVAGILTELRADVNTICAGILHDVIEDTNARREDIVNITNERVYKLVLGVTKITSMNFQTMDDYEAENIRNLLISMTEDVRVIVIKLADRIHNMRTLEYMTEEKQKQKAIETMELYVPFASYLGSYQLKDELADLSFKYINPEIYFELSNKINKLELERKTETYNMINKINKTLKDKEIPNYIKSATKNLYATYKRIQEGHELNNMHDLFSLRIVLKNEIDCYTSLGYIHKLYKPINDKFKDYIANKKTNGYQSLHTTVFGEKGNITQMRIRTEDMEEVAQLGIPSYWQSEEIEMNKLLKEKPFYNSLKDINKLKDNLTYLESLKKDILSEKIYVFTPKGDVTELPKDSTPIDFAYKIHTELGNSMSGVLVNNEPAELNKTLKNNDIVKIITKENSHPNKDWLVYAKTNHAQSSIRKKLNR